MSYRVRGLDPAPFRHLYGLGEAELAGYGAQRRIADVRPGFPDRIEVRDAEPGESLLLLNHIHQRADSPYRASHAIFVREGAETPLDLLDALPEALLVRPISLRGFDDAGMMVEADLAEGSGLGPAIERLLANRAVAYLHAHYARPGCYAALIARA
ncbi:MAG TPA: DUF1203 domain-containing protein [Caulobacteraceae bacterium]|nr:DUF1203 domain-containing protein [Caulobacteraceae bacterium]